MPLTGLLADRLFDEMQRRREILGTPMSHFHIVRRADGRWFIRADAYLRQRVIDDETDVIIDGSERTSCRYK